MGLYAIYSQNKFNFEISEVGIFTILNVTAMGFFSYISGNIGDRFGHKYSLVIAYALHLLAILLVLFSKNMLWVYCVFIAVGAGQGTFMPSAMTVSYTHLTLPTILLV